MGGDERRMKDVDSWTLLGGLGTEILLEIQVFKNCHPFKAPDTKIKLNSARNMEKMKKKNNTKYLLTENSVH